MREEETFYNSKTVPMSGAQHIWPHFFSSYIPRLIDTRARVEGLLLTSLGVAMAHSSFVCRWLKKVSW